MTWTSRLPTINKVGARTRANAEPAKSGPAASRNDRRHGFGALGRGDKRRAGPGAGSEVSDRKRARVPLLHEPVGDGHEPSREQPDIEAQMRRAHVNRFFFRRKQIDQESAELYLV